MVCIITPEHFTDDFASDIELGAQKYVQKRLTTLREEAAPVVPTAKFEP